MKRKIFILLGVLGFASLAFGYTTVTDMVETLPQTVATLLALFSPVIIQKLKVYVDSKQMRWLIALGLSALVGVVSAFISGVEFSYANIITFVGVVYSYSQIAYNTWKSVIKESGSALESAEEVETEDEPTTRTASRRGRSR